MSLNKSQKQGIIFVGVFVLGAVSFMIRDLGIGWILGIWAVFIVLAAVWGKAGRRR